MQALFLFIFGFASGSVLYSAFLPRLLKGIDVTRYAPDHNPGAANAFAYAGVWVGSLALVCDLAKAYVPVRLGLQLLQTDARFALVLCAPVLGHAFSPFARFRGGKAIAASFGALLALCPVSGLVWHLAFWYILFSAVIVLRPNSIRSILVFVLVALAGIKQPFAPISMGTAVICATVIWRHLPGLVGCTPCVFIFHKQIWPRPSRQTGSSPLQP